MISRRVTAVAVAALTPLAVAAPVHAATASSERELAPGVTVAAHEYGRAPARPWTVAIHPSLTSRDNARRMLRNLDRRGLHGSIREVRVPSQLDVRPRRLGYSVRVGRFRSAAQAGALAARLLRPTRRARALRAAAEPAMADGGATTGPWRVRVVRVDPRRASVRVTAGAGVARPETVRAMARDTLAAVNGGYFLIRSPVPGDPVGVLIQNGTLLSSDKGRRSALLLRGGHGRVTELYARLRVRAAPRERPRNTGLNALPDADSVVAFTPEYGAALPRVAGREVMVDAATQTVVGAWSRTRERRATTVPPGRMILQGTGGGARWLAAKARPGRRLAIRPRVVDRRTGRTVPLLPGTYAVGGNVTLVRNGRVAINAAASDVASRAGAFYGMVLRRLPRTMAGVDGRGRLLLVTVDGRRPRYSAGMTLREAAALMRRLGAVNAVNLDGGGSTTMVVRGEVVNRPSDGRERRVGTAVLVTPGAEVQPDPFQRARRMSTRRPSGRVGVPSAR